MHRVALLLVAVMVVGSSSACKYWCKNPSNQEYECCDDGNPYFQPEEEEGPSEAPPAPTGDGVEPASSGCYYYCAYDGEVYCCGDDVAAIPDNHDPHTGRCPEEEEQVCKSSGIFLVTKKAKLAKTSGSIQLVSGEAKQQPVCASDGYCAEDQKCCPSKCARRHICMKSLSEESDEEEDADKKL
ncbi:uncharacterized protein [Panulirus ornatus]|uniref:uncharacterized protein n=1 Tax=Panulirus ornatus TaxID=150431 RepID=UPI003A88FC69